MRRYYYWVVVGAIGFLLGQGVIVMWPEWSAWTWWGLATAVAVLFLPLPTLWDKWKARQPRQPGTVKRFLKREASHLVWATKITGVITLIFFLLAALAFLLRSINSLFPQ